MKVFIGTSGWNYESFRSHLYGDAPKSRFFEIYLRHFDTVELNASFYRSFGEKTWLGWYKKTPTGFIWAVKASRYITHIRRLDVEEDSLKIFFERARLLKEKLGPVLFQLPPNLPYDRVLFTRFLERLKRVSPRSIAALEARHPTWHCTEVFDLLDEHSMAWVVSHTGDRYPMTITATGPISYFRLHGPKRLYHGEYGKEALSWWLDQMKSLKRDTYCYFDNTDDGSAVKDALALKELVTTST